MFEKTKKPQTIKRNIDLGVKVSTEEERKIIEKASSLGMTKSDYVRFLLLNAKVEVSV